MPQPGKGPTAATTRAGIGPRFFVLCALIVVAGGVITAIAMSLAPLGSETPLPPAIATAAPVGSGPVTADLRAATSAIRDPKPWQYDPLNDQHWDPGHKHWHPGPPPEGVNAAGSPEPWSYDAAKNQHWHPGHNHWHPGPPPPPDQRQ